MSSGLAAPIPQVPRSFHDFLDPDSWPARQLETALARLQSVQAVLQNMAYDNTKAAQTGTTQAVRTTLTWTCYPTKVTSNTVKGYFETDITDALTAVTTAQLKVRKALGEAG